MGEVCIQGPSVTPGEEEGREGRGKWEGGWVGRMGKGREGDGKGGNEMLFIVYD